jgi:hypothetical protein
MWCRFPTGMNVGMGRGVGIDDDLPWFFFYGRVILRLFLGESQLQKGKIHAPSGKNQRR